MKNAIIYLIVYLKCSHQHVMCRSLGVVKILEAVTKCFVSFTSLNTIVKKINTNLKHGINFILALDIYLFIFFSSHFLFAIFSRCWDHKLWIYRWYWHIREIGTASVILCDSFYLNWMTHTHTQNARNRFWQYWWRTFSCVDFHHKYVTNWGEKSHQIYDFRD